MSTRVDLTPVYLQMLKRDNGVLASFNEERLTQQNSSGPSTQLPVLILLYVLHGVCGRGLELAAVTGSDHTCANGFNYLIIVFLCVFSSWPEPSRAPAVVEGCGWQPHHGR